MTFIVLDTETSGLPITPRFGAFYDASQTKYYDSSRLIQVAVVSNTESHSWLIIPEDFEINNEKIHKITHDHATKGVSFDVMITELVPILQRYDKIVGHNILFDLHVLNSELYRRNKLDIVRIIKSFSYDCTMYIGKSYMTNNRFPKLSNLYELLFKQPWTQIHDALEDSQVTFDCYNRMCNSDTYRFKYYR